MTKEFDHIRVLKSFKLVVAAVLTVSSSNSVFSLVCIPLPFKINLKIKILDKSMVATETHYWLVSCIEPKSISVLSN